MGNWKLPVLRKVVILRKDEGYIVNVSLMSLFIHSRLVEYCLNLQSSQKATKLMCVLTRTIGPSYSCLKVRDVPSNCPSHAKSNNAHISYQKRDNRRLNKKKKHQICQKKKGDLKETVCCVDGKVKH